MKGSIIMFEDIAFLFIALIILVFTYFICQHIGAEKDFKIILFIFGFACIAVNFLGYASDAIMLIGIIVIALVTIMEVKKSE